MILLFFFGFIVTILNFDVSYYIYIYISIVQLSSLYYRTPQMKRSLPPLG